MVYDYIVECFVYTVETPNNDTPINTLQANFCTKGSMVLGESRSKHLFLSSPRLGKHKANPQHT